MKKYVVVKTNLMNSQKFYLRNEELNSWSPDRIQAHKYTFKRTAAKIAKEKEEALLDCFKGRIKLEVEVIKA